jgi:hypothetical protein
MGADRGPNGSVFVVINRNIKKSRNGFINDKQFDQAGIKKRHIRKYTI